MPGEILAGQEHQQRGSDRADEIADIDDCPCAQHVAQRQLAGGPGHHHQIIAGEQFGAAEHDQDQPETEHDAGQEPAHAERNDAVGAAMTVVANIALSAMNAPASTDSARD